MYLILTWQPTADLKPFVRKVTVYGSRKHAERVITQNRHVAWTESSRFKHVGYTYPASKGRGVVVKVMS